MTKPTVWPRAVLALAFAAFASPLLAKTYLTNIPLVWKPTTAFASGSSAGARTRVKIQVESLVDTRGNPALIGENREDADEGKVLPVSTRDDVAGWCTERLRILLRQSGFDVVSAGGDILLSGEVSRFFVAETSLYKAEVGLKIEMRGSDGKPLWSGVANGSTNRFGRSYKAENYYEVLSDSFLGAVQQLVETESFLRTIANGGAGAVGQSPGQ